MFPWRKASGPLSSKETAKERLRLILVHDRAGCTPQLLENLKEDMLTVISKYMEVDEGGMEIRLSTAERQAVLEANIPVRTLHRPRCAVGCKE